MSKEESDSPDEFEKELNALSPPNEGIRGKSTEHALAMQRMDVMLGARERGIPWRNITESFNKVHKKRMTVRHMMNCASEYKRMKAKPAVQASQHQRSSERKAKLDDHGSDEQTGERLTTGSGVALANETSEPQRQDGRVSVTEGALSSPKDTAEAANMRRAPVVVTEGSHVVQQPQLPLPQAAVPTRVNESALPRDAMAPAIGQTPTNNLDQAFEAPVQEGQSNER